MNTAISLLLAIALLLVGASADASPPYVRVETNLGAFTLELDPGHAPITVANFLRYLDEGFYKDTLFHRSVKSSAFSVVQGGGFVRTTFPGSKNTEPAPKTTHSPIVNESKNGLSNVRGTVGIARVAALNSATSQFYVNTADNTGFDYNPALNSPGYAVFGKVIEGMATLDAINALQPASNLPEGVPSTFEEAPIVDTSSGEPVYVTAIFRLQPTADAGLDLDVDETSLATLDGSGSKASATDVGIASYQWKQTAGPTVQLSDPAGAQPQFKAPAVSTTTTLSFDLAVTDKLGTASSADSVDIRVHPGSNTEGVPYAYTAGDFSVAGGATATLDGSRSNDPTHQALTYRWTQFGAPQVQLSDPAAAKPGFTAPILAANTVLTFRLVVTDTDGHASAPATVNVAVKRNNHPPVANAGPGGTIRAGAVLTLDGSGSYDPDSDALTYAWTAALPGLLLSDNTARKPTVTVPAAAIGHALDFGLKVSDGEASSTVATVSYTVVDNSPPKIDPDTRTAAENTRATLSPTITDPDGDALDYAWTQIAGTPAFLAETDGPSLSFTAPWVAKNETLQFLLFAKDRYTALPKSAAAIMQVQVTNDPSKLDCSAAVAYPQVLARPTGGMARVAITGIAAPTKDLKLRILRVTSDEPVTSSAYGDTTGPDARIEPGVPTAKHRRVYDYALVRAERHAKRKKGQVSGNGRIYGLRFRASYHGQTCTGVVGVGVPGPGGKLVNDGQKYNASKAQ